MSNNCNLYNTNNIFSFLCLFGDGKPQTWWSIVYLGTISLKVHQYKFEKLFKRMLEYGLIYRVSNDRIKTFSKDKLEAKSEFWVGPSWKDYDYRITEKGDACLRDTQIRRGGDYSYYKYFDRSISGKHGVNKYAPIEKGISLNDVPQM